MKIFEITSPRKPMLTEAKARIDHPEDIMFDENGIEGAQRALSALMHAADNHATTTTIKWDGSPAVIFGWLDKSTFIVTDKAGIGAKKYDGRPTSAAEVTAMIYNRQAVLSMLPCLEQFTTCLNVLLLLALLVK